MSLVYALLCIGLAGGFIWLLRNANLSNPPPPVAPPAPVEGSVKPSTNRPAPSVAPPQRRIPETAAAAPARPVQTVLEAQIALVRQGISPGSIDGAEGPATRAALIAFQRRKGLVPNGRLDSQTKSLLLIAPPVTTQYAVTSEDFGRLTPIPETWLGKSEQTRLDFENILELLGEKAFSSPQLIRALNPQVNWNRMSNGALVTIPRVDYPTVAGKAAFVRISLQDCVLEAFDSETNLLVHFPCSIGRLAAKRPVGQLHVTSIIFNPNYTFDPAIFPESPQAQELGRKLVLPPGPNNPVGVAWIGLDRPGYGIHGTPSPERIGRAESHGCFRLANWNANYLAKLAWVGMTVVVE